MISAQEVWNSFYTDELESIWKSEREALRKPAMIYYVLTQELQKVQENLADEMKQFEHQVLSKQEHESTERRESVAMPLSQNELNKNPAVNKQRNISLNKKLPKLLLSKNLESTPTVVSNNADVVDSQIYPEPVKSFIKRGVKRNHKVEDITSILTQPCKTIRTSNSMSNQTRLRKQTNGKKFETESKDVNADKTVCDMKMETSTTSEKDKENTFKDHDEFSIARPKSPILVHKTEPVRRKADGMQLPGLLCENCGKIYESSNIQPEKHVQPYLRKKVNPCSKHAQRKFKSLNYIFKGFWDAKMFSIQDEDK